MTRWAAAAVLFAIPLMVRGASGMQDALIAAQYLRNAGVDTVSIARLQPGGEDGAADGRKSYVVVFEFEGIVWSYASDTGTSILGPRPPGDTEYREMIESKLVRPTMANSAIRLYRNPARVGDAELLQRSIANACVISSLVSLAQTILRGGVPAEAGLVLLSYDAARPLDPREYCQLDHCVLVYRDPAGWWCIDPAQPDVTRSLRDLAIGNPVDHALLEQTARYGRLVQRALYLPVEQKSLLTLSERLRRIIPPPGWPPNSLETR